MQRAAAKIVTALPMSSAAKAGVIADVMGQINSYIELRGEQESASPPTARRLSVEPCQYVDALQNFACSASLKEEKAARRRNAVSFPVGPTGSGRSISCSRNTVGSRSCPDDVH
jgi:hypothetical protein